MDTKKILLSGASVEAKLTAIAIMLGKELPKLEKQVELVQKLQGPPGIKGKDGQNGKAGIDGQDGKDGAPGVDGQGGKDGQDGEEGKPGISVVDAFIDFDRSLVLKLSDGREINAGSLEYDEAKTELYAVNTPQFSLDSLNLAAPSPKPTEVIVKQNGIWVRSTWTQFTTWIGTVGFVNKILTEGGDFLVAEDGSYLIEE
jgi:hypothetical protein